MRKYSADVHYLAKVCLGSFSASLLMSVALYFIPAGIVHSIISVATSLMLMAAGITFVAWIDLAERESGEKP